jgi:SAM-dependent methyltransferase
MSLPVKPGVVDAVISDGVLPYTDDPVTCLKENLAILKPGGRLFLALYKRDNYYYYLYSYVGAVFRGVYRLPLGRALLHSTAVAAYHFLRNGLRRSRRSSWKRSKALFYDYFLAPRIRFYTREQVQRWVIEAGASCLRYDRCSGWNAHAFILEKPR